MRQPIVFGKYLLLERISVGGMAEVFKAKYFGEEGFEKILAIKRILPSMAEDEQFITMFIDEAKIAGDLAHPNIGQIYELGQIDNGHFIAMEYIWGKDVLQIQNRFRRLRQKMPQSMAAFIASRVCEGLDYAHRKTDASEKPMHIIHRDVSPQNILVSYSGEIKIIDFGIAKARSRSSKTQAGVLKGKFGYMSPEQVRGLPLDQRSDIFSIGTLLFEMTTGERLFTGETDFATLDKVRNAEVPIPSDVNDEIMPEMDKIVLKALSRNPDNRYQWASDMQEDLSAYVEALDPPFRAKELTGLVAQLFTAERGREQSRMEEYHKISKVDMEHFVKPSSAAKREVVMSLMPLDSVVSGEHHEVLASADVDELLVAVEDDDYGDNEATMVGASPQFFAQQDDSMLDDADIVEVVDELMEVEDDGETRVFGGEGDPAGLLDEQEPMTAEPTFIFNAQAGKMEVLNQPSSMVFDRVDEQPAGGEMPSQGPTVLFDTQAPPAAPTPAPPRERPKPDIRDLVSATMPVQIQPKSSLVKDIFIGVLVAMLIISGIVIWRFASSGGWKGDAPATLVITARPSRAADVYVDGQLKGKMVPGSPFTLKGVSPTKHVITLKGKDIEDVRREVALKAGDVKVVTMLLNLLAAKGRLSLKIDPPGATVYVDGNKVDLSDGALSLGADKAHTIRVTRAGYKTAEMKVSVKGGQVTGKDVKLQPEVSATHASIKVSSTPSGATVQVNGKGRGTTPVTVSDLPPGTHEVSVAMEGYKPRTEKVDVQKGKELDLALTMQKAPVKVAARARYKPAARARPGARAPAPRFKKPAPRKVTRTRNPKKPKKPIVVRVIRGGTGTKPPKKPKAPAGDVGYLVANTMPWGAKVIVDGKNTGLMTPVMPRKKIPLKPGRHKVTFVLAGKKHNFSVTVKSGKIARLIKKLPQ